jgi:hypothetical protein
VELELLGGLVCLGLITNQLSGPIPAELGKLGALKRLVREPAVRALPIELAGAGAGAGARALEVLTCPTTSCQGSRPSASARKSTMQGAASTCELTADEHGLRKHTGGVKGRGSALTRGRGCWLLLLLARICNR